MGTIAASEILDKVAQELFDITGTQWARTELLGWLNDGQRQIVMLTPQSTSLRTVVQLQAGTEQTIPDDGWMLIDVYRNMGTDGQTPGRAIRLIARKLLDSFNPDWHSAAQVAAPKNYLFDPQSVTQFWVNPPSDGTGFVEINYSQVPADLASENDTINVNNIFETALVDYILYRACSKNVAYSPGKDKAAGYFAAFQAALNMKTQAEMVNDPNQDLTKPPAGEPGVHQ
ncbi:MAG: phage adaptor protein [Caldimonas sp.]